MKLNKTLLNAIYRNGKKLKYNRSFRTLAQARKFVSQLKSTPYMNKHLTQIRKNKDVFGQVHYAVYSTY
jgi:hypothetical protein